MPSLSLRKNIIMYNMEFTEKYLQNRDTTRQFVKKFHVRDEYRPNNESRAGLGLV